MYERIHPWRSGERLSRVLSERLPYLLARVRTLQQVNGQFVRRIVSAVLSPQRLRSPTCLRLAIMA